MPVRVPCPRCLSLAIVLLALAATVAAQRDGFTPTQNTTVEPLRFRYMGPPSAGRISAAAGIPGDTRTYYAGAASGGVWKTTDGGQTFAPTFDAQPVQAIGALAVALSERGDVVHRFILHLAARAAVHDA